MIDLFQLRLFREALDGLSTEQLTTLYSKHARHPRGMTPPDRKTMLDYISLILTMQRRHVPNVWPVGVPATLYTLERYEYE